MPSQVRLNADLCFSLEGEGIAPVRGQVQGSGSDLVLTIDRPEAFAGSGDAAMIRGFAAGLAKRGLRLHVQTSDGRPLVSMGAVRSPWWQRPATRSRHLRVGSVRGLLTSARARTRSASPVLPAADLRPPLTPYPLAPMFLRRPVRHVTTTHDRHRGGLPRLVVVPADGIWTPESRVLWLQSSRMTIGSGGDHDLELPGVDELRAEVVHDDADEFVLVAASGLKVNGSSVNRAMLRTGARVELGPHVLAFVREEYADHGRPFGGRVGGELGRQRTQSGAPREGSR